MTAPDGWLDDQPAACLSDAELDRIHADDYTAWDAELADHIRSTALGETAGPDTPLSPFVPDVPDSEVPF